METLRKQKCVDPIFSYEEDVDESVSVLHQVDELMEGKEEQQIQALDLLLQFREQIGDTSGTV